MARQLPDWQLIASLCDHPGGIIGIDEVGRGAWAGPVVAAAVMMAPRSELLDLRDSKQLVAAKREQLNRDIRRQALAIGIGWVGATEVDAQGLSWAVRQSGLRALADLTDRAAGATDAIIILDGKDNYLSHTHQSRVFMQGDAKITPVAAASVIAKVARDRYMAALAKRRPGYGFEFHKGYGTAGHQQALAKLGVCADHRRSYSPLRRLANAE